MCNEIAKQFAMIKHTILTQKCVFGTIVTAHMAERMPTGVTYKLKYIISEITHNTWHFYSKSFREQSCYL